MQNSISEVQYEKFVLEHLAPMSTEATKRHIDYSLQEELLEIEKELRMLYNIQDELTIWQTIKPNVKFVRAFKREATEAELKEFKASAKVNRTLDDGTKISKTFDDHVADLFDKKQKQKAKILDELGDILFFVVAAGSDNISYVSHITDIAKNELHRYMNEFGFTIEDIRLQNFNKLAGGENARYKNGYSVKEDLERK